MQHSFELTAPVEQTWELLNKIDEIAPCLPGASATKRSDEQFEGSMRVRLGPLDMTFKGAIDIIERDVDARRVVLRSKGSEARGQGTASATTVANLVEHGETTKVVLDTDLMISGRIAQMGRGMLVEISNDLLEKFVTNLKGNLDTSVAAAVSPQEAVTAPTSESGPRVAALTDTALKGDTSSVGEQYLNATSLLWRVLWRKLLRLLGLSRRE
jgi:carbon monoxide dehydrogenase subunit G